MEEQYQNCVTYFNNLILEELHEEGIDTWIAGGAVRDYFSGKTIDTDIDLFFSNEEDRAMCVEYLSEEGHLIFENENAYKFGYKGKTVDIVKMLFDGPEDTISHFDFTVCCVAVDGKEVCHHKTFFPDLAKRALVINEVEYPMSTLWRLQKYIKKGFTICKGGLTQIAKAIHEDLDEKEEEEVEIFPDVDFQAMSANNFGGMFMGID